MVNELSYWEKERLEDVFDITIIGAGIVGLSTAISLKELDSTIRILILERGNSPLGASTKNAGFGCFGSVSEILDDLSNMTRSECKELISMRWLGLNKLQKRIPGELMHYESLGAREVFRLPNTEVYEQCLDQISACNVLVEEATGIKGCYEIADTMNHFNNLHPKAILNSHEGQLNPVKMMTELHRIAVSSGVQISYGMEVTNIDLEKKLLEISQDISIPFDKVILCTNAFTRSLFPKMKVLPARNQVLITEPVPNLPIKGCYHMDKGYLYFRNVGNRILFGGGRNLDKQTEMTDKFGTTSLIQDNLKSILKEIFNVGAELKVAHVWSGILGVHDSKRPIIKWFNDDILLGVRLGGMGVAIGSHLGEILANMIISGSDGNSKPL